ncbi:hypothetical protein F4859DRAFT_461768 [Xylaria cf. heliscus]|nr:hypothetical protein F4859DRAFT_461768 [Xylaria cf. heliscus]
MNLLTSVAKFRPSSFIIVYTMICSLLPLLGSQSIANLCSGPLMQHRHVTCNDRDDVHCLHHHSGHRVSTAFSC